MREIPPAWWNGRWHSRARFERRLLRGNLDILSDRQNVPVVQIGFGMRDEIALGNIL